MKIDEIFSSGKAICIFPAGLVSRKNNGKVWGIDLGPLPLVDEAIKEIDRFKGIQFDPIIADIFIQQVMYKK